MLLSISRYTNYLLSLIGKSHIFYYWIPAISVYLFLLFLTVLFFFKSKKHQPLPDVKNNIIYNSYFFVLILSLAIFLFRWPYLAYMEQGPDESQQIAGAMKLLVDPVFWRSVDGSTNGPLVFYVLLLPRLFGLAIDYGSTKLVGLGLMIGSIVFLYGTLKNLFKDEEARVAILPLATFIALLTFNDYLAYNGEHFTVFLLCTGLYVCSRLVLASPQSLSRLGFILGLILGAVPYAKLQGVPIALAIAIIGYLIIYMNARDNQAAMIRPISYLTIGGFTVTALVFSLLLYFGIFHHFWNSYILDNFHYATTKFTKLIPQRVSFIDKLIHFPSFIVKADESRGFFAGSLMVFISGIIFLIVNRKKITNFNKYIIGCAFLIVLASVFSVFQTGYHFYHYLIFLFFTFTFMGGSILGTFCSIATQRMQKLIAVIFLSLLLVSLGPQFYNNSYDKHKDLFFHHGIGKDKVSNKILSYASPGDRMIVWGFSSFYYVETGLIQGTRESYTKRQIINIPLQPYFMERFLADMKASKPPVFIDVVPDGLLRDKKTQGHDAFPEVSTLINKLYRKVAEIEGARIYISNERLANLPELMNHQE